MNLRSDPGVHSFEGGILPDWSQCRRAASEPLRLVLGTMNFGKRTAEPEAQRIVHRALERGVVLLDTANAYVDGEGERIVGRALQGRRSQAQVATKVGLARIGGTPSGLIQVGGQSEGLSARRIVEACEQSLTRLGTDYVDLYFLHVPDALVPIEQSLSAIGDLLKAGKIRAWATSNYASWQLLEMIQLCDGMGLPRPALAQQMYNLVVRQLDVEYFAFAAKYGLHTSVYNPLAGGLLTGRHTGGGPPQGSRFAGNPMYQRRYYSEQMLQRVEQYRAIAAQLAISLPALAMRWLAALGAVDSVVIGPGNVSHLDEAIDAAQERLDAETLQQLDALHTLHQGTDARYARI